jgi:hypothetical protein
VRSTGLLIEVVPLAWHETEYATLVSR